MCVLENVFMSKKNPKANLTRWFVLGIALLTLFYTILLTRFAFLKLDSHLYNALDLAIFQQVFWQTLHGSWFGLTIHPHLYLGDHASFLIPLLLPIFALIPSPKTLLLLQAVALTSTVIPLSLLILRKQRTLLTCSFAFLVSFLWLINPFLHNVAIFEFHMLALLPPLLAWTYLFFRKNHLRAFLGFCLLLLLLREDTSLIVAMFGLLALMEKRSWKWSFLPLTVSVTWFFFSTQLIGHLAPGEGNKFLLFYAWMGEGITDLLLFFVQHPIQVLQHLLTPTAVLVVIMTLMPSLFLGLIRPRVFLLALPSLGIMGLALSGINADFVRTHYQLPLLTASFLACTEALPVLYQQLRGSIARSIVFAGLGIIAFVWSVTSLFFTPLLLHPQASATGTSFSEIAFLLRSSQHPLVSAEYLVDFADRQTLTAIHYAYVGRLQFTDLPFPLPLIDGAVISDDELLRLLAIRYNNPWATEGIEQGTERLRAYLAQYDLQPVWAENGTIVFLPQVKEPISPYTTTQGIHGEALRVDVENLSLNSLQLRITTAHTNNEDLLFVIVWKEVSTGKEQRSYHLPAYGLIRPKELDLPSEITTQVNLHPALPQGLYQWSVEIMPVVGGNFLQQNGSGAFVPKIGTQVIAKQEGGFILIDENGVWSEEQTKLEEIEKTFE